jgi:hypothetical protein
VRAIASIHLSLSSAEYAMNDQWRVSVNTSNANPFVVSVDGIDYLVSNNFKIIIYYIIKILF